MGDDCKFLEFLNTLPFGTITLNNQLHKFKLFGLPYHKKSPRDKEKKKKKIIKNHELFHLKGGETL